MKSKEFALMKIMGAKIDHSKLDNLWYSDLSIQKYLTASKFTAEETRTLFLFRTRMAQFGENFRNGKEHIICPLCQLHYDSQNLAFQCQVVNTNIMVNGKYEDIFKEDIPKEVAITICNIVKFREQFINERFIQ